MAEPHARLGHDGGVDQPGETGIEEGGKGTVFTQHHHAQRETRPETRVSRAPRLLVTIFRQTVAEPV
ncbi:hypothetical protein MPPM_0722 [Methylorubrum populi]|uniref:Uncharacterized protein n=1 Tax=Methylorubrum populi TaxID=223967 RepID=A0A160P9L4_9HYPH|nr:hypothetical protein MPPM_0722 [Methylorubrum populi]